MNHSKLLFALFLVLSQSLMADPGLFRLEGNKRVAKIPFHLFDNKVVIPVEINDRVTLNFILDSGVSQPLLTDRRWGKLLDFEYVRDLKFLGAGNQTSVKAKISKPAVKLKIGAVVGEEMTMVVLEYDFLKLSRFDIHGILGAQLFMRFVVRIDYENKFLWFIHPDEFAPPAKFAPLELELIDLKPHVQVSIPLHSKNPVQLLVDSGASYSVMLFHRKALKLGGEKINWYGLSGEIKGHRYVVPQILLGAIHLKKVKTILVNPDSYSKSVLPTNRSGCLGGAFLKQYTVIFDYSRAKMYLKPRHSDDLKITS